MSALRHLRPTLLRQTAAAAVRSNVPAVPAALLHRGYATAATDPSDRYIMRSVVPSPHYQKSLPRLPVPKLEDTLKKYLENVQPLVSAAEFEETTRKVAAFGEGEGKALHEELVALDKKNKGTSYISAPWFEMYLKNRTPLPINVNPFMAFQPDPNDAKNTQLHRASNLIYSAMRFYNSLRDQKLEPDIYHVKPEKSDTAWFRNLIRFVPRAISWYGAYLVKAFPLDMSQYNRLFSSTRVPREGMDELASYPEAESRHVIVMKGGHFFPVTALRDDGTPVPLNEIHDAVEAVLRDSTPPAAHDLGFLTSDDRDAWARARAELVGSSEVNCESLRMVDSALFVVALDESAPDTETGLTSCYLHNEGKNRWWDKSFSLYVSKNGRSALNFEHAWGDGVAVLRFFNEVHKDACQCPLPTSAGTTPLVTALPWQLSAGTEAAVAASRARMDKASSELDIKFLLFQDQNAFGKNFVKKSKMSPDGVVQMAFQLAYYRFSGGQTCGSYESCSQSAFKHGRTETVRPCSNESVAMCEAFESSKEAAPVAELAAKLKAAQAVHSSLVMAAAMGKGVDRHLFALKYYSDKAGLPVPALYTDKAYAKNHHNILSTSTLASPALIMGGFGPVVDDGFGIGYMVDDELCGFNITSYRKDLGKFMDCLQSSVEDIKCVLEGKDFR